MQAMTFSCLCYMSCDLYALMACAVSDISKCAFGKPCPKPQHTRLSGSCVISIVLSQVEYLSKHEYFGDVSVTKTPIAQTTAVTSTMTTTLLVISK